MLKRALPALPFVLAALPLIFTGRAPMIPVFVFHGISLGYSPEGLGRFAGIAIKSWMSVQAAVLLTATTRFPDLLWALQQLRAPKLFVSMIGLMWRYLFVISDEAVRMMRARSSRSSALPDFHHGGGTVYWRARVTGGMIGSLFLRALERSDRVYAAMLSRGYTGELPADDAAPLLRKDRRILMGGVCFLVFLWVLGLLTGG